MGSWCAHDEGPHGGGPSEVDRSGHTGRGVTVRDDHTECNYGCSHSSGGFCGSGGGYGGYGGYGGTVAIRGVRSATMIAATPPQTPPAAETAPEIAVTTSAALDPSSPPRSLPTQPPPGVRVGVGVGVGVCFGGDAVDGAGVGVGVRLVGLPVPSTVGVGSEDVGPRVADGREPALPPPGSSASACDQRSSAMPAPSAAVEAPHNRRTRLIRNDGPPIVSPLASLSHVPPSCQGTGGISMTPSPYQRGCWGLRAKRVSRRAR